MRMPPVVTWLLRVCHVKPDDRHVTPDQPEIVEWTPPPAEEAPPARHVDALIDMMHTYGKTGVQPHTMWLKHYPEAAWQGGLVEISERTLLRHLGLTCTKTRGKNRVVCYVVPKRRPALSVIPSGNLDALPWPELPERARTGTAVHA